MKIKYRHIVLLSILLAVNISAYCLGGAGNTINELSFARLQSNGGSTTDYSFVVVADMHYIDNNSKCVSVLNEIANLSTKPKFIITCGDNVTNMAQYEAFYSFASDYISQKGIPLFCMAGNHDLNNANNNAECKQYMYPDVDYCAFKYGLTSFVTYDSTSQEVINATNYLCDNQFKNSPIRFSFTHAPYRNLYYGAHNWEAIGFDRLNDYPRIESQHTMHKIRQGRGFLASFAGHIHNWEYDINLDGVDYMGLSGADYKGFWFLFTVIVSNTTNDVTINMLENGTTLLCSWTVTNDAVPTNTIIPRFGNGKNEYILTNYNDIFGNYNSHNFLTNKINYEGVEWGGGMVFKDISIDPSLTNNRNLYLINENISALKNTFNVGMYDISYRHYKFFKNGNEESDVTGQTGLSTEINNEVLTLSPNPTSGIISFTGTSTVKKCSVYTVLGLHLRDFENVENGQINISDLPPGTYCIKGITNNGSFNKMISKQ